MKTEDATAAVLKHDLSRYVPMRVVYKVEPETGTIRGFTEESFSMGDSTACVRIWWSGKAYSLLGEHMLDAVADAEQYVRDGYISVDPLSEECLIDIDWVAWKSATTKYSKRNAPFKIKVAE